MTYTYARAGRLCGVSISSRRDASQIPCSHSIVDRELVARLKFPFAQIPCVSDRRKAAVVDYLLPLSLSFLYIILLHLWIWISPSYSEMDSFGSPRVFCLHTHLWQQKPANAFIARLYICISGKDCIMDTSGGPPMIHPFSLPNAITISPPPVFGAVSFDLVDERRSKVLKKRSAPDIHRLGRSDS